MIALAHAHSHSPKKHKKLWLLLAGAVALAAGVTLLVLWLTRPAVPVSTQGALDATTPFTCTVNLHTGDFDAAGTLERTQPGEYRFTLSQPQELEGLVAQYGAEGLKLSFHGLEFAPEVESISPRSLAAVLPQLWEACCTPEGLTLEGDTLSGAVGEAEFTAKQGGEGGLTEFTLEDYNLTGTVTDFVWNSASS